MWLLSQAKWPWTVSETNFKISSDFSFDVSDLNIKNEKYNNLWSLDDFSIVGSNKYYNSDNNFTARGEIDISSDNQGDFEIVVHYKKVDNNFYINPEINEGRDLLASTTLNTFLDDGNVLGIKMAAAGDAYTSVSFSYSDALHDPDHHEGMSEDEIFAMYDYLIIGEYTWSHIQNPINKEKAYLYLDIYGKDHNRDHDDYIFPAPLYWESPHYPDGHGDLPTYVKTSGSPYAYQMTDEYLEDLLGKIEEFYIDLQSQGIEFQGFFLDDFMNAPGYWDENMALEHQDIAWEGRSTYPIPPEHDPEHEDFGGYAWDHGWSWWVAEQYPRVQGFEDSIHDLTMQYWGRSEHIVNGSARKFRTLPSGYKEPYYYDNPLYTPGKISHRCFEGPAVSMASYVNFPELLRDPDHPDYMYWRALFPKDLLLMYSVEGEVDGRNGRYGEWVEDSSIHSYLDGLVDWTAATEAANERGPEVMVALEYGDYPATGGTTLSLFTNPILWPYLEEDDPEEDPYCGDGVINQDSEECDDGNNDNGDGCDANCQIEEDDPGDDQPSATCGDGVVNQDSEECDDGNTDNNDGCGTNCKIIEIEEDQVSATCGDGVVNQDSEECDDGNTASGDGCSSICLIEVIPVDPYCGDESINQETEECDDGNSLDGDGCSSFCKIEPYCGDGEINRPTEECDDGNGQDGDGCSFICTIEIDPIIINTPPIDDDFIEDPLGGPEELFNVYSLDFSDPKTDEWTQVTLDDDESDHQSQDVLINFSNKISKVIDSLQNKNIFKIKDTRQRLDSPDGKLARIQLILKENKAKVFVESILSSDDKAQQHFQKWHRMNPEQWQQMQHDLQRSKFYIWINRDTKNVQGIEIIVDDFVLATKDYNLILDINFGLYINTFGSSDIIVPSKIINWQTMLLNTYQNIMQSNKDSDNDGLLDSLEKYYGTDPNDPDSDNDGFWDGEEIKNGYNPLGLGSLP